MTPQASTRDVAALPTEQDPRWQAVLARDPAADGTFFYSVATTGVYCFPSCAARRANPANVRFHATREDAERAGFRPCKRCKSDRGGEKRHRHASELQVAFGESSLGAVLVARSISGIAAVLLGDDSDALRRDLQERFPLTTLTNGDATLEALVANVVRFVESPARGLDATLDMRGTEFQRQVWCALREIPAGSTATYTDVAERIGRPRSVRAVAQACAANPLAVVVPCHRVLRRDGQLSGYRWGIERKRALLGREAVA
ncbi:MAG TPA: methylated-DNA--[protein]-cysteine S-methyltransferase [Candidatus Elarobacter sp.]|nr:methylated-DNA--[protein]-cysteine S-methyltransferase [Candidatus Elarobacter sp.]